MNWDAPDVQRFVVESNLPNKYFVDIGAGDGDTDSNTACLARSGWRGLFAEMDPEKTPSLRINHGGTPGVHIFDGKVTPPIVASLLRAAAIPEDFAYLSLDIDGYDLDVLAAIIEGGFKPRVITVEINEVVPPPVIFSVKYSESYRYNLSYFFGASLQAFYNYLIPWGYRFIRLNYNNAYFAAEEICESRRWYGKETLSAWVNEYASFGEGHRRDVYRPELNAQLLKLTLSGMLPFIRTLVCTGHDESEYNLHLS